MGLVTDLGVLDISFTGVVGSVLDDRDRGALAATQPLSDLLRDFAFISEDLNAPIPADGVMDITIEGLDAGDYEFKGYFHDRSVDHVSGDVAVSTDGGGTFAQVVDNGLYSFDTDPPVIGTASFYFTSNGVDPVVVKLTGQEGFFFLSGTFRDQDTALISGFEITQVPEPGTLALALLASAAFVARWRR
ncbi:PEP-CTERM sorting domain-containing protein [Aeoliella sp.]|uniref:PEP-CTERM sorting domain-containing protein n=1 Tax=Aeoliella sp. TaxID=2795800 RepID=UPI003CCC2180